MAVDNVANFINLTREDVELRTRLEKMNEQLKERYANGAPPSDEERRALAEKYIIPLAREAGLEFTVDELANFISKQSSITQQELSLDELEMVGGGKTYCLLMGYSRGEIVDGF